MIEDLFSKRLPVLLKCSDREDRKVDLYLKMELQHITTPIQKKELIVRLTDEKDLFFLYTLKLGEEEFQILKSQQGLLVDFGDFPQKVIDLLNMCLQEEHKELPKFILQFVSQGSLSGDRCSCVLNIVETNPFKHLIHLSLKFLPGNDNDVKKYLADCLRQLKETNELLHHRLEHTNTDLNQRLKETQELLTLKSGELEKLRNEWTAKITENSAKHKQELASEKEKSLQVQNKCQQKLEHERKEMEQAHMRIVKEMEGRMYELESGNRELVDRKYKLESTVRELKSKLSSLEEEHCRAKQELQMLRKQNAGLDADYHEKDKVINSQWTRIAVLEQEVKDKEQVLAKSTDLLSVEQNQKRKYEESLESRQREVGKLESKVKAMGEELKKGNEIIRKLQGEIKNYHAKIKLRSQIATEQEKLLGEKDQTLAKLQDELKSTKESLHQKVEENTKLNESLESTVKKLEESRELLKTNENVIQWLNKQVNETQMSHTRPGRNELPNTGMNFRLTGSVPMNNFSTSTFSTNSRLLHQDSRSNPMMAASRSYPNPHKQPQVQYNPGNPKKSVLPVPVSIRGGPIPPIPEEIQSHSANSSPGSADKENDPPLDPKYLQKKEDTMSARGLARNGSPPNAMPSQSNPGRVPQHLIVAKPSQPPLASAYFPGQLRPS